MKKYIRFVLILIVLYVFIIGITNYLYIRNSNNDNSSIVRYETNGQIVYNVEHNLNKDHFNMVLINCSLVSIVVISLGTYIYISKRIIKPFSDINDIPYELAKGNLSIPLKEQKNKFFGRFLWGMNMLRENLEDSKKRELRYQKDKKTLILSLSHDIKTPLSAIKLYSKALKDNLYDTDEKREEVIDGILKNTDVIECYVNEIVKNSRDDFIDFQIDIQDFYLRDVIFAIEKYYKDKLEAIHTNFFVNRFNDCLLKGDKDRVIEVIQNVIENAIKYGDGEEIIINFSEEEDCKLISILNTGCCLNGDELPHIFDSFYRGSNTKNQYGSGLGLYICKQLMHKMDGDIFSRIRDNIFETVIVIRKV